MKNLSYFSIISIFIISFSACNYDSGSNKMFTSLGHPISLACFKKNIANIKNLSIASQTDNSIELSGTGIKSKIEFNIENSTVVSYTITTHTEKTQDAGIHDVIENQIKSTCL